MSIHDETWDKCPKCKQVIRTWHGDFHDSGGCLNFDSWFVWNELKKSKEAICESNMTTDKSTFFIQECIPEMLTVKKDVIYSAIESLKLGLEYSQEVLADYDQKFGRSRPRNKREAEQIEEDIAQIKKSIKELNK